MATKKAPFITKPLGAYYNREVPKEDDFFTRVGPDTPAGEYLRRFWQPVAYCHQLTDLPLRVRIMGEDLVVFRDKGGKIGLLELHCNHRGTSLEYGKIEHHGIRCCYHGWLFDVDGRILEMPLEPPDSTLKDRLYHGAYIVREYSGIVFAYMGPPDKIPEFPMFDLFDITGYTLECGELSGTPTHKPYNWTHVVDDFVDILGEAEYLETPTGILALDIRRVGDCVGVRNIENIWPNIAVVGQLNPFPPKFGRDETEIHSIPDLINWAVPVDDTNNLEFSFKPVPIGEASRWQESPAPVSKMGGRTYEEEHWLSGGYEPQSGQRSVARHGLEHRRVSSRGASMVRNGWQSGIQAVQQGVDPVGVLREPGKIIPTYGGDTALRIPPASTEEEDKKMIRKAGQDLAHRYLKSPPNQIP
jgi:nitrite reductase/ring-hydroxylating ferredoxin subunit